jgi:hypothetical protein
MKRTSTLLIAIAIAAASAAGCGDSEKPATAATPAAAAETSTPEPGCHTDEVVISITGGEGLSCKAAKRIYTAYANGKATPKGWDCAVRACTNVEGDEVLDFTWEAVAG